MINIPIHLHHQLKKIQSINNDHYCISCYSESEGICINLISEIESNLTIKYNAALRFYQLLFGFISLELITDPDFNFFIDHSNLETYMDLNYFLPAIIGNILLSLSNKERKVIIYRFGFMNNEGFTLEEIGQLMGVTRERIRQIESNALKKLKKQLNLESLQDLI